MKLISLSEDMIRSINGIEILTFDDDGPILAYNIMGVGSYAEPLTDELREYLASLPLASPVRSYYFTDSVDDPSGVKIGQKTLLTNLPKELIRHIGERTIEKFTGEEVGCARCGARAKTTRVSDHEVIKENVCLNGHFGEVWAGGHRSLKQFSRCSRQIREITKSILTVGLCVPKKETSDHEFASTQLHALMTNSRYASVRNMSFNLQVTRRFTLVLSSGDDFGDYSLELLKELLNVTVNLHSLTIDLGDYSKRSHIQLLVPLDLHDLGNLTALKRLSVGKYDYEWISKCPNITHFATHGSHHNTCFDESWTNTGNTVKLLNALSTCKYLTSVDMDTTWTGDLLTRIFKNHPELTRLGMFGTWEYCFPVGLLGNPRRWNAKAPVPDTIGVFVSNAFPITRLSSLIEIGSRAQRGTSQVREAQDTHTSACSTLRHLYHQRQLLRPIQPPRVPARHIGRISLDIRYTWERSSSI